MKKVHPYILSGGSGSRLWPHSRKAFPKQFIPLIGEKTLFQETCQRLNDEMYASPVFLGNQEHRFLMIEQLQEIGITPEKIVLEPFSKNTASAALIAALMAGRIDRDKLLLLLPCDHIVSDVDGFTKSIQSGIKFAESGHIVVFGLRPEEAKTGYGYIETGQQKECASDVVRFIEKPERKQAQEFVDKGNYLWNAGIFLSTAGAMIKAFETHSPDLVEVCQYALDKAKDDHEFLLLNGSAYKDCTNISLDFAILEKASNLKCVSLETGWSDVGSWPSVWQAMDKDKNGNVQRGDVILKNTKNSYVHSVDQVCLSLIGLSDVFAVATKDAILLASKKSAQKVSEIVGRLEVDCRSETNFHRRVHRPWGWHEGLSSGERYQVKCLMVKPGAQLSLQSHNHRAEHWIVVSGTARVTIGANKFLLTENQSTYIPIGSKHRLENPGKVPARLIEVQSGTYLGEDDIVRFKDDYGRLEQS